MTTNRLRYASVSVPAGKSLYLSIGTGSGLTVYAKVGVPATYYDRDSTMVSSSAFSNYFYVTNSLSSDQVVYLVFRMDSTSSSSNTYSYEARIADDPAAALRNIVGTIVGIVVGAIAACCLCICCIIVIIVLIIVGIAACSGALTAAAATGGAAVVKTAMAPTVVMSPTTTTTYVV